MGTAQKRSQYPLLPTTGENYCRGEGRTFMSSILKTWLQSLGPNISEASATQDCSIQNPKFIFLSEAAFRCQLTCKTEPRLPFPHCGPSFAHILGISYFIQRAAAKRIFPDTYPHEDVWSTHAARPGERLLPGHSQTQGCTERGEGPVLLTHVQ